MAEPHEKELVPWASSDTGPSKISTVDGSPLSEVRPGDLVVSGGPDARRQILLDSRIVVTEDGHPIDKAPDGAHTMLGGEHVAVKVGGEVVAHTMTLPAPDQRPPDAPH